jgi:hypothetical protein
VKLFPILGDFDQQGRNWFSPTWTFRHKKTGKEYQIVTVARREKTLEVEVVYRSVDDFTHVWIRPASEWLDGRFEIVP